VTDVVAGRSDFSVQLPATSLPLIKDGKLVALAVSAQKRTANMPDVPTTLEAGLKDDSIYPFYSAVFVPSKTPRAIVDKLHAEVQKAIASPNVQARFKQLGVEPLPGNQEQFAKFFHDDVNATTALARSAKVPQQ
jgi:tripartite-type tricarboxylate transporter receptor subunit TctC